MSNHLYILGFMGSGKTTLFEKWSSTFEGTCYDFDHELARISGIEPDQLGEWIKSKGWEEFRKRERELLLQSLDRKEGLYALGGGTFSAENAQIFQKYPLAKTLWVQTPVELCWERVKEDSNRPLVKAGKDEFISLYKEREKLYKLANYRISGDREFPSREEFWKNYVI